MISNPEILEPIEDVRQNFPFSLIGKETFRKKIDKLDVFKTDGEGSLGNLAAQVPELSLADLLGCDALAAPAEPDGDRPGLAAGFDIDADETG